MGFKNSISLPLEAGSSVLDVHVVPPRLQAALEYVAARLARKSLALDLVLVRRDYQLPSVRPPFDPPASPPPPTACSTSAFSVSSLTPQQPGFAPVSALRQLARTVSRRASDPIRRRPTRSRHGSHASLASLPATLASLPATLDSLRRAPSPVSAAPFGVCLVHDPALSPRARKILCGVLAVAEQKFGIGGPWFSRPLSPAACGLPAHLFSSSVVQNEVLFASPGLSLVSLDRFFSLKCALSSYSMTRSRVRLEDAADELHRFVLANNGTRVSKTALVRSYDWLSLSDDTIHHLDRMYRQAYGGPDRVGAIAGMPESSAFAEPSPSPSLCGHEMPRADFPFPHPDEIGVALTTPEVSLPPSPISPAITLQTVVGPMLSPTDGPRWPWQDDEDDDDDIVNADHAALPENFLASDLDSWPESSIDHVMSTKPVVLSPGPLVTGSGPLTPNTYGDISPVTRDEWGFLMVDSPLRGGRTVTVETC